MAEHHGYPVSFDDAIRACAPGPKGATLAQIAGAAERFGFKTLLARLSVRNLVRVNLPCIAYWKDSHFVIIEDVIGEVVYVADPSVGRVRYSVPEFLAGWSQQADEGVVLLLEPAQELEPAQLT